MYFIIYRQVEVHVLIGQISGTANLINLLKCWRWSQSFISPSLKELDHKNSFEKSDRHKWVFSANNDVVTWEL